MSVEKYFLNSNKIFGSFLLLLLIYSFDFSLGWGMNLMFPNIYIFTHGVGNQGFSPLIWMENGIIETSQVIILMLTLLLLVNLYFTKKTTSKLINVFLIIKIIGITYIFLKN